MTVIPMKQEEQKMPVAVQMKDIEQAITDALAEIGPEREDITREATLETLDVDSLDLVEIAQVIEEEFGVKLTMDDGERLRTVGDVFDLVYERTQQ
jgi:acyl carrier protein